MCAVATVVALAQSCKAGPQCGPYDNDITVISLKTAWLALVVIISANNASCKHYLQACAECLSESLGRTIKWHVVID